MFMYLPGSKSVAHGRSTPLGVVGEEGCGKLLLVGKRGAAERAARAKHALKGAVDIAVQAQRQHGTVHLRNHQQGGGLQVATFSTSYAMRACGCSILCDWKLAGGRISYNPKERRQNQYSLILQLQKIPNVKMNG